MRTLLVLITACAMIARADDKPKDDKATPPPKTDQPGIVIPKGEYMGLPLDQDGNPIP